MGLSIETYDKSEEAVKDASAKLYDALNHSVKTLLLLSGGSSLRVAKDALSKLNPDQKKLITIAQVDERYGKPGHKDSNWKGIDEIVGGFDDYAGVASVLEDTGDIEEDAAYYNAKLRQVIEDNVLKIGLFGVGTDGHVAGILPGDEADFLKYTDGRLVVNFQGNDFPRITTTSALMRILDEAIVFACGPDKEKAINDLNKRIPANEHPAQLLKRTNQANVYYAKEA